MSAKKPAMPEGLNLGALEKEIYSYILDNWPTTPLEIAREMKEDTTSREKQKRASTKYAYYLKKLVKKKLLLSKRAGNSIIVWPLMVEKYRTIHNILKHHENEHIAIMNEHHKGKEEQKKAETEENIAPHAKILGVN